MEKDQFGVWSLKVPDSGENPGIPHNSKVKFRFMHGNGVWVDRIPAWIKYATVDPTTFGAPYDGVYWDPPPSERCQPLNLIWIKCRYFIEKQKKNAFQGPMLSILTIIKHNLSVPYSFTYL